MQTRHAWMGAAVLAAVLSGCGSDDSHVPQTEEQRISAAKSAVAEVRNLIRNAEDLGQPADLVSEEYGLLFDAIDGDSGNAKAHVSSGLDEFANALQTAIDLYDSGANQGQHNDIAITIARGGSNADDRISLAGNLSNGGATNLSLSFPSDLAQDNRQQLTGSISGFINLEADDSHTDPDLRLDFDPRIALTITKVSSGPLGEDFSEDALDGLSLDDTVTLTITANDGSGRSVSFNTRQVLSVLRCTSCEVPAGEAMFNPANLEFNNTLSTDSGERIEESLRFNMSNARSFDQDATYSSTNFVDATLNFSGMLNLPGHGNVNGSLSVSSDGFNDATQLPKGTANLSFTAANTTEQATITLQASFDGANEVPDLTVTVGQVRLELRESGGQFDGEIVVNGEKVADIDTGSGDSIIIRYVDGTFESLG